MWLLKACPRCHGDLALERDARCVYLGCVQCGHILSREEEQALGVRPGKRGLTHLADHPMDVAATHPPELAESHGF